jgi:hypothetical protein
MPNAAMLSADITGLWPASVDEEGRTAFGPPLRQAVRGPWGERRSPPRSAFKGDTGNSQEESTGRRCKETAGMLRSA